jgi:hypothetical protein
MPERLSLSQNTDSANVYRSASAAVDSKTPLTVLAEIREGQPTTTQHMHATLESTKESELRKTEQHRKARTLLPHLSDLRTAIPHNKTSDGNAVMIAGKSPKFYHGSHPIANGTYLIGCILMHLDIMLRSHSALKATPNPDTTYMDGYKRLVQHLWRHPKCRQIGKDRTQNSQTHRRRPQERM